jgi:ketosteroid isomerase-like protein
MKTLATLLLGITIGAVGAAALGAVPVGPADEATKAAVQEVKRGIVAGHKAKDRAALDRLYADDYTAIDAKGAIRTKQDLLAALPTDAEIAEGQYDLIAVRRWGTLAVATGRGNLVYRNADGSTRVSNYYSFNVFEQRDGRWVYSAAFLP